MYMQQSPQISNPYVEDVEDSKYPLTSVDDPCLVDYVVNSFEWMPNCCAVDCADIDGATDGEALTKCLEVIRLHSETTPVIFSAIKELRDRLFSLIGNDEYRWLEPIAEVKTIQGRGKYPVTLFLANYKDIVLNANNS